MKKTIMQQVQEEKRKKHMNERILASQENKEDKKKDKKMKLENENQKENYPNKENIKNSMVKIIDRKRNICVNCGDGGGDDDDNFCEKCFENGNKKIFNSASHFMDEIMRERTSQEIKFFEKLSEKFEKMNSQELTVFQYKQPFVTESFENFKKILVSQCEGQCGENIAVNLLNLNDCVKCGKMLNCEEIGLGICKKCYLKNKFIHFDCTSCGSKNNAINKSPIIDNNYYCDECLVDAPKHDKVFIAFIIKYINKKLNLFRELLK